MFIRSLRRFRGGDHVRESGGHDICAVSNRDSDHRRTNGNRRDRNRSFAVGSANDIPVSFTAPADWTVIDGWSAYKDAGSAGVLFDSITNIYAEGCQWVLVDPPVGPTVDDLATAWANVANFAATTAVDVTVDGYAGKQFEFTAPDYTASECRETKYGLWDVPGTGGGDKPPGYWAQLPNQHLQMWVLDVDGTRLVIGASTSPGTSPQDRAALEELVASIQIG